MKVDISISPEINEPFVVIHTKEMTDEIVSLAKDISEYTSGGKVIGNSEDKMIVLEADTISVIRVDNEKVFVVSEGVTYANYGRIETRRMVYGERDGGEYYELLKAGITAAPVFDNIDRVLTFDTTKSSRE